MKRKRKKGKTKKRNSTSSVSAYALLGRQILLISLVTVASIHSLAQRVDSSNTIERIKTGVIQYLQANENLEELKTLAEYDRRITIVECLSKTTLGYNKTGIYAFSKNTSHSKTYLLLKEGNEFEIFNPDSLGLALNRITRFLVEHRASSDDVAEYVQRVITVYKMNNDEMAPRIKQK